MTKKEFDEVAKNLGATVVFKTSATAVFNGPRFCVTIEMDEDQLKNTHPVELSHIMATVEYLN